MIEERAAFLWVVFAPGGCAAPQMPLGLVAGKHSSYLDEQPRADRAQPGRNIFMHSGFAQPKDGGGAAHGSAVLYDVFPQQDSPPFRITFHAVPS